MYQFDFVIKDGRGSRVQGSVIAQNMFDAFLEVKHLWPFVRSEFTNLDLQQTMAVPNPDGAIDDDGDVDELLD